MIEEAAVDVKHGVTDRLTIEWDTYTPHPTVQKAVDYLNQRSPETILEEIPAANIYRGKRVSFDYRVYGAFDSGDVKRVYVLLDGFGVSAGSPDSGVKNLLTDLLLSQTEHQQYAVLVIGGLFSFPHSVRTRLFRQGYGALAVVADDIVDMLQAKFGACQTVTVSGYSLGGVLAPLVARAVIRRGVAAVEQVCCGEPSFAAASATRLELLTRVAHSTNYRNEQIKSTAIRPYIAIKTAPDSTWAMLLYRAKQYRPLCKRLLSMHLVVQDLALQARKYPPASHDIQIQEALIYLMSKGIRVNLLHAEFSSLCHNEPFTQLIEKLVSARTGTILVITITGTKADHGIEERRTLSAPFLVKPELYLSC
ncbi:MAG TPA: hypothetical protein VMB52_01245 [Verrucomicrobiae bacterium]|nr:hypothetical protein [Verrucomicrobiae bacterium]